MPRLERHAMPILNLIGRLPAGKVARVAAGERATTSHAHPGRPGECVGRSGGVLTHGGLGNMNERPAAALDPVQQGVEEDAVPVCAVERDVIVNLCGRWTGRGHDHGCSLLMLHCCEEGDEYKYMACNT
mmetsp:Transcript_2039/g.4331  ORF Transcript_2039/g.4331 Transcript_2039/m.4331 type:complete len:129 (+) Transcript_2039:350-736(+)